MIDVKQRKVLFAVLMSLTLFAACKGESPTSPTTTPPTTSTSPTPPVGASVTLTVSNAAPLVNSTSTVTATVSENGQPVPNGTAVQFTTTLGTFTDVGSSGQTIIKTTTNGVATATITAGGAGTAVVTATVNNVSKTTNIVFSATPTTPQQPDTTPTIANITPTTGRPQGGETIVINGTNFRNPVRVIFTCVGTTANPPDPGVCAGQGPKEALVTSVTPTQIQAITPSFNVPTGQAVTFTIQVIVGAGTPNEQSVTSQSSAFTLTSPTLTPTITTVSPATGPFEGGTRITIHGSNFQAPVQVTAGAASGTVGGPLNFQVEMQVISVTFNEIIAITPEYRLIDPDFQTLNDNAVSLRVLNVNSAQSAVLTSAFRYIARMQITAVSPLVGSSLGGTLVVIDGLGFDDPVTVSVGEQPAQVIRVSGTQVTARTRALPSPCSAGGGPITVTNVNTGDTATSKQAFQYIAVQPSISGTSSSGTVIPGSTVAVTVLNPGVGPLGSANVAFNVGSNTVTPTPSLVTTGTGSQIFNIVVPTTLTFPTVTCTTSTSLAGVQLGPITPSLVFNNLTTGCNATLGTGLTVQPPGPNTCTVPPTATVTSPAQTCPAVANLAPNPVASAGALTQSATITITNSAFAAAALTLSAPAISGVTPVGSTTGICNGTGPCPTGSTATAQSVAPGGSVSYVFTIDPFAAGADGATITFTTNDPLRTNLAITVCGGPNP